MTIMEILNEANYYSQSNETKGWSVKINRKIVNSNSHIITPAMAQEIKTDIQPKETFPNVIDNYDEEKIVFENDLNQIIMTKQDTYHAA